jgi:D-alanyl-D-alanine carboxypeptidase
MTHTAVVRDPRTLQRVRGHSRGNKPLRPGTVLSPVVASAGSGGICSTVTDLAKWEAALNGERVLKRSSLEQMTTPVTLNSGVTHPYGFGWELGQVAGRRRVSHAGKWIGFAAQLDRYSDDGLTVIVLSNLAESDPARLARMIAGTFVPALAPARYAPIEDHEPAVTARLADVVRRTAEEKLGPGDFAAETWAHVQPLMAQMSRDFTRFGPLRQLTLVERSEVDGNRSYRYRAQFGRTSLIFHFLLTHDDRILGMMPER